MVRSHQVTFYTMSSCFLDAYFGLLTTLVTYLLFSLTPVTYYLTDLQIMVRSPRSA